jgi:radical SAM superfamily enzyme YgiQ (UPF0313 family)
MKITLIRPMIGSNKNKSNTETHCMEPLELATLAGFTPAGIDIEMFDDRIENIPYNIHTDLVGITVDTFTAKRAYFIASVFRKRNIPVVLGGCHPTVLPDEAIQHCDSVVIGEAEEVWPKLIKDVQQKRLQKYYRTDHLVALDGRLTRREIFKGKKYIYPALVEFGRGCKFHCTFCSIGTIYKNTHRHRPINDVIEEIRQTGKRSIFFSDDNIVANPEAAKKLFEAMIPLKIKWSSQTSLNFVNDHELVNLMVKSGCWGLFIGFESLRRENLEQMKKESNLGVKSYENALKIIRDSGIKVWASFMIGWDYDTMDVLKETLRFAVSQKFFLANFNNVLPYPGTPLYERLSQEGRLLFDKWWLDDQFQFGGPSFRPRNFKPDELCDACYQARLKYNTWRSLIKRGFDFKANVQGVRGILEFFLTNRIFLREVRRKQGMTLGFKHE